MLEFIYLKLKIFCISYRIKYQRWKNEEIKKENEELRRKLNEN